MINDEREAFLRQILATPDEKMPYAAYADWLREGHDPLPMDEMWAEMIQIDNKARTKRFCDTPDAGANELSWLRKRQIELIRDIRYVYVGFRNMPSRSTHEFTWVPHYGLIKQIKMPMSDWHIWGPVIAKQHPIAKVEISDWEPFEYEGRFIFTSWREVIFDRRNPELDRLARLARQVLDDLYRPFQMIESAIRDRVQIPTHSRVLLESHENVLNWIDIHPRIYKTKREADAIMSEICINWAKAHAIKDAVLN